VTVAPVSQEIVKVGVVSVVMSSVDDVPVSDEASKLGVPGAAGVEVSIVTERLGESDDSLPATSVKVEVILCTAELKADVVMLYALNEQVPEPTDEASE